MYCAGTLTKAVLHAQHATELSVRLVAFKDLQMASWDWPKQSHILALSKDGYRHAVVMRDNDVVKNRYPKAFSSLPQSFRDANIGIASG